MWGSVGEGACRIHPQPHLPRVIRPDTGFGSKDLHYREIVTRTTTYARVKNMTAAQSM